MAFSNIFLDEQFASTLLHESVFRAKVGSEFHPYKAAGVSVRCVDDKCGYMWAGVVAKVKV